MGANVNSEGLITLEKRVELLPYKPRPFITREYLTDAEILSNTDKPAFVNVECYPNYFLITFKIDGKFVQFECGEGLSFNPKMLSWIMQSYRTVGFNSIKFDLIMIWCAYHNRDTYILKNLANDLISYDMRKKEAQTKYGFFSFKSRHIDLIEVAPLKGSLKLYGARLHTQSIEDQPFPHDQVLNEQEIEVIKNFNMKQLDITQELYNFMKERLELREAMGQEYNEDLMSKSDAQIAEVVLAKEIGKLNGQRPKRQEIEAGTTYRYSIPNYLQYQTKELQELLGKVRVAKFIVNGFGKIDIPQELTGDVRINMGIYRLGIGGLHSSEVETTYNATNFTRIVDRDVASYYPRLITNLKLYPQSCGPNFLIALEDIIQRRLYAKKRKIFTTDKGLKIVINGLSGKLSDIWSVFYSPDLTIQMTVTGQLDLLMLIEALELSGIQVISANTDGIVMLVTEENWNAYLRCVHWWEQTTGFETEETLYSKYCARDVNAYFAVKMDNSVKVKGNPYNEVGSQSGTQLDTNPVALICSDAIKALLAKNVPIEKTIRECKNFTRFVIVRNAKAPGAHKNREYLGRVVRWYWAKGEIGAIRTVQSDSIVAGSEGGRPCLDLPATIPDDIDYARYEAEATKALYDIGYLKRPKQLEFF